MRGYNAAAAAALFSASGFCMAHAYSAVWCGENVSLRCSDVLGVWEEVLLSRSD